MLLKINAKWNNKKLKLTKDELNSKNNSKNSKPMKKFMINNRPILTGSQKKKIIIEMSTDTILSTYIHHVTNDYSIYIEKLALQLFIVYQNNFFFIILSDYISYYFQRLFIYLLVCSFTSSISQLLTIHFINIKFTIVYVLSMSILTNLRYQIVNNLENNNSIRSFIIRFLNNILGCFQYRYICEPFIL